MPLRIWRRKDGRSGNWYVMGTVVVWRDGRKRTIKIKQESTGTTDRHEAEAILHQIEARYRRGNIENRDTPKTFADLVHTYLDAGKSERYLIPAVRALGDMTPEDIDQATVDSEGRKAYPKASGPTLRRQWHGVITAVLNHSKAPVLFSKPQSSKPTTRWCTPVQADAIIRNIAINPRMDDNAVALAEFLFGTGCRTGEALSLETHDISLEYATVTFRDTKNGYERTVPLLPRVMTALRKLEHLDEPGRVFRKPDGEGYVIIEGSGAKMAFMKSAAQKASVSFNPHMARHSFATWFHSQISDTRALREFGGWRSESMVDRYTHFVPKQVGRDALKYGWDFSKMVEHELERGGNASKSA